MRTLLILIALAVIVMVGKRLWQPRRPPPRHTLTGRMVQCAHCGIFIPEHEAIRHAGRWFCTVEHREATDV
jgi:uncharacterized protein